MCIPNYYLFLSRKGCESNKKQSITCTTEMQNSGEENDSMWGLVIWLHWHLDNTMFRVLSQDLRAVMFIWNYERKHFIVKQKPIKLFKHKYLTGVSKCLAGSINYMYVLQLHTFLLKYTTHEAVFRNLDQSVLANVAKFRSIMK